MNPIIAVNKNAPLRNLLLTAPSFLLSIQREPLSIVRTNQQFAHKLFRLQLQKPSCIFPDQTPGVLAVTSFVEAESRVVQTLSSPMAPVETGNKQKVELHTPAKKGLKVRMLSIICLLLYRTFTLTSYLEHLHQATCEKKPPAKRAT